MNFLKPKRLINKAKFKASVVKNKFIGYKTEPIQQLHGTCWFYSILNLIKHSTILKHNIAYSVMMHRHMLEDVKKPISINKNTCSAKDLYHKTLKIAFSGRLNQNELRNFITKVTRSSHFRPEAENNKLEMGGFPGETLKAFRNLLRRVGLPQSSISTEPKEGYTLAGSLITFEMKNKKTKNFSAHVIAGITNSSGRRKIINSAFPTIYNINWNKNLNSVNKNMRNKWSSIKWSNTNNFNRAYHMTKIYVKKLY